MDSLKHFQTFLLSATNIEFTLDSKSFLGGGTLLSNQLYAALKQQVLQ